jgi:hypothetical protein
MVGRSLGMWTSTSTSTKEIAFLKAEIYMRDIKPLPSSDGIRSLLFSLKRVLNLVDVRISISKNLPVQTRV